MYLVFDLGATKLRISTSVDGEKLINTKIIDTPNSQDGLINIFSNYKSELKIDKAGGCLPGVFDKDRTTSTFNLNIPYLVNFPLKQELEKVFNCNVVLENDAICASLGEAVYGAGAGEKIVAYLTVSTGVGGARVVDGKVDMNSMGFEPGYQVIDFDGSYDIEITKQNDRYPNNFGYLQRYISGEDIERKHSKSPEDIMDQSIWDEMNKVLAFGINNTIVYWSPDIIVLGGSISVKRINLEALKKSVNEIAFVHKIIPKIKIAILGDDAGLYGSLVNMRNIK